MTRGEAFERTLARNLEMIKTYYNEIDNLVEALNRELGAQTNKIARSLERGVASNGHGIKYLIQENYDFHQDFQTTLEEFRHLLIEVVRKKKCQYFNRTTGTSHLLTKARGWPSPSEPSTVQTKCYLRRPAEALKHRSNHE